MTPFDSTFVSFIWYPLNIYFLPYVINFQYVFVQRDYSTTRLKISQSPLQLALSSSLNKLTRVTFEKLKREGTIRRSYTLHC